MKKRFLLTSILIPLLLVGCSKLASLLKIKSDQNYDSDPISEVTDDGVENDFDGAFEKEADIPIPNSFDGENLATVTGAGNYYYSGNVDKVEITKAAEGKTLYFFLNGVEINCSSALGFGNAKNAIVYIILMNGSTNTIVTDYIDSKGEGVNGLHIKGDLHISGNGTLNIESKQKNGLKVSKDLYIQDVTLNVIGVNHAIAARSIIGFDATINATAKSKDGIQLECDSGTTEFTNAQGFAYLVDCNYTSDTYGDGIQAATTVYISGGSYNITTHGEFVSYSSANMSEYGLTTKDFRYIYSNGSYKKVGEDEVRNLNSSYYALKQSVKGIKAGAIEYTVDDVEYEVTKGDYEIYIAHAASITVDSTDDCIHTNYGNVTFHAANLVLSTVDDGVHADYDLLVNNASIQINSSYEGLEGANVTVDGEQTNIIANSEDDGINAANDSVETNNIYIKNGYLRVYASGDGLDANTGLYLQGGTVIVEGPGSGNGSLDADNVYFEGGIVFACSTSGMTEKMTASQNTFAWQGSTIGENTKISIVDPDSNALFSYTLKRSCNQIIFSHSELEVGKTYTLASGSSSITTIAMTSSLTKIGIKGNNGGGGGPGGPGGQPF